MNGNQAEKVYKPFAAFISGYIQVAARFESIICDSVDVYIRKLLICRFPGSPFEVGDEISKMCLERFGFQGGNEDQNPRIVLIDRIGRCPFHGGDDRESSPYICVTVYQGVANS